MSQSKRCIHAQINAKRSLAAVTKICGSGIWIKSSNDEGTPRGTGLIRYSEEKKNLHLGRGDRPQTSWRAFSQLPSFPVTEQADIDECSPDRQAVEPTTTRRERIVDREGSVLEVGDPVPYGSRVMVINKTDRANMIELRDNAEFQASAFLSDQRI